MTYTECLKNLDKVEEVVINTCGGYPYTEEEELLLLTLDKARKAIEYVLEN